MIESGRCGAVVYTKQYMRQAKGRIAPTPFLLILMAADSDESQDIFCPTLDGLVNLLRTCEPVYLNAHVGPEEDRQELLAVLRGDVAMH